MKHVSVLLDESIDMLNIKMMEFMLTARLVEAVTVNRF